MSKREDIAASLVSVADELDQQREAADARHRDLLEGIARLERAFGHWIDDYNLNKSHVEEQFRREGENIRKLQREVAALQLAGSNGNAGE